MAELSRFVSRSAALSCTAEKFYWFVTDIRKFGRFIPPDVIKNWQADENSCSFMLSGLGDMKLNISEREPYSIVKFGGNALNTIDFVLSSNISEQAAGKAKVELVMEAHLNPIIRMMASKPIENFLETLVNEMEKFDGWDSVA